MVREHLGPTRAHCTLLNPGKQTRASVGIRTRKASQREPPQYLLPGPSATSRARLRYANCTPAKQQLMRPLRVVVIDDEPNTCSFLRSFFEAEGHECHTFLRADEAEAHLAANEADLALVDVYLGSASGIDLV